MTDQVPTPTDDSKMAKKELKLQADRMSWKDEMWTVAIGGPIIMSFIPGLQGFAAHGFQIMSAVPVWYVTTIGVCVAYAFHRKVFSLWSLARGVPAAVTTTAKPTVG